MKKKILAITMAAVMTMALTACGGGGNDASADTAGDAAVSGSDRKSVV